MRRDRLMDLDALRAFSVMLVLWTHASGIDIGIGGYHGVLLFFVISGFLITGILLDSHALAVRREVPRGQVLCAFYARRFLRIFPVYYAVLFLAFALGSVAVRHAFGWHLGYLSNWYFAYQGTFDGTTAHLWSLAVEEQFYLVWPWFALLVPRPALVWCIGGMILIGPMSRFLLGHAGVNSLATWVTTPTVLDALGLGCLLAYVSRESTAVDRIANWALAAAGLLFGLRFAMMRFGLAAYIVFTFTPLAWALLWMWLVHRAASGFGGWPGRILRSRPIVYVGMISYGIYLVHLFIVPTATTIQHRFTAAFGLRQIAGPQQFLFVALLSIASATLSWYFLERPINALKRYFPYVPDVPRADATSVRPSAICLKD